VRVERTRIGEAHVVEGIRRVGAVIGGEGNGGVIYPAVHPGRDAATGIALILSAMAASRKPLSALNAEVPDYAIVKSKVGIEGLNVAEVLARVREKLARDAAEISELDGLKIVFSDSWVHVRPSGTEPILRIFAEAPEKSAALALARQAAQAVRG
jgi:phosphomannomutase